MPIRQIERIRESILDNLKTQLNSDTFMTSILADKDDLDTLLGLVNAGNMPASITAGTSPTGALFFMVGISDVGGTDVVSG